MANPSSADRASGSIHHLRTLAEQHLREIEHELAQEDKDEAKRLQELERYTKRRRGKDETTRFSDRPPTPKMRPAQGMLDNNWFLSLLMPNAQSYPESTQMGPRSGY